MRVLAFAGTNSRQSINKALLNSTLNLAEDLEIEWADMNDYEMPLYSIERNEEGVPEAARGGISADSEHTDKRNKEERPKQVLLLVAWRGSCVEGKFTFVRKRGVMSCESPIFAFATAGSVEKTPLARSDEANTASTSP